MNKTCKKFIFLPSALLLASCSPDYRHAAAGPPMTAALPDRPTIPVDNPFLCPKAARP